MHTRFRDWVFSVMRKYHSSKSMQFNRGEVNVNIIALMSQIGWGVKIRITNYWLNDPIFGCPVMKSFGN